MSTVQNTGGVSQALMDSVNGTNGVKKESKLDGTKDRFMTLLVAQMRNQDPLSPMDNAQMTSQLAQLSTVSGIEKLNTTLESLMGSFQATQSLQAANMIGHGVLVPGATMELVDGKGVFGVDLPIPADEVKVTIRDTAGNAVQTMRLGATEAGAHPLLWNGEADTGAKMPNGKYTFEVEATLSGERIKADTLSYDQVLSVTTGAQGVKINLPSQGAVNFADVRQIL